MISLFRSSSQSAAAVVVGAALLIGLSVAGWAGNTVSSTTLASGRMTAEKL